jgi:hypothetical protein
VTEIPPYNPQFKFSLPVFQVCVGELIFAQLNSTFRVLRSLEELSMSRRGERKLSIWQWGVEGVKVTRA